MGDPSAPPLEAGRIFQLLERHGVRYVVVGGLAATAHGATRVTYDLDLVPEWTDANLARLAAALVDAHAELRVPDAGDPVAVTVDAGLLKQFEVSTWRTDHGDLDVIVGTPTAIRGRLSRFEALQARSVERGAFGVTISVGGLDDVIESKQARGREPDLVALPELHRIRERRRRESPE